MEVKVFKNRFQSFLYSLFQVMLALCAALAIGFLILALLGKGSPLESYSILFRTAFGSLNAWDITLVKAIPLVFTALSFTIAARCGLVNLGADGQFAMGALSATFVGLYAGCLPPWLHLSLTVLSGFLGGALYGLCSAWFKIHFGVSELLTTIMLNYIARQVLSLALNGPIKDPRAHAYSQSRALPESARLHPLVKGISLHSGFMIMLFVLVLYHSFIWYTRQGFQMRVVGSNPYAARLSGMNSKHSINLSMFLAGGFAGLGGCIEILAVQDRLILSATTFPFGLTGIAVALLGKLYSPGILAAGIVFGGLSNGTNHMHVLTGNSASFLLVIEGLVILFIAGRSFFVSRLGKVAFSRTEEIDHR